MAEVNTFKGQFVVNIFSLLFAAGRACLLPFLSIYFFYLGLSATQTGLLLGLKSFTSVSSALCWTKYVSAPKRKRCVLVFSITVLMLTHLAMMLMPALNLTKISSFCPNSEKQTGFIACSNDSSSSEAGCQYNTTTDFVGLTSPSFDVFGNFSDETNYSTSLSNLSSEMIPNVDYSTESTIASSAKVEMVSTLPLDVGVTQQVTPESKSVNSSKSTTVAATDEDDSHHITEGQFKADEIEVPEEGGDQEDFANSDYAVASKGRKKGKKPVKRDLEVDAVGQQTSTSLDGFDDSATVKTPEDNEDSLKESNGRVGTLMKSLNNIEHQVFIAILVLVLVGEMFSSPTERITEDLWLRFLDSFEKLDRSHIPRMWASLGSALTPWAVVLVIDYLPCSVPFFQIPRILIHFFSFEAIIAITLLLSFCYPVVENDSLKVKKWSRFFRGLRILCSDVHSFLCMFTIVIVGFIYGFINTFLFWLMHELSSDGSELPLGIALTVAASGEFFMSFVAGWFVQKLKCPVVIILGLAVLCARCLLYSFLFDPWIAVIGEAGHMLSHTLIWAAVQNYPAFRINPLVMDTSAHSALSVVYSGFGISSGCMVAGLCYSLLGPQKMFQIAATVAGAWCLIFAVVYKCCSQWRKQQRVRYTKIAQEEEMADSDGSDVDWLDSAVKRKK